MAVDISKLKDGSLIKFQRADGMIMDDVVRGEVYKHTHLVEPYGRNYEVDAVVLTNHSWTDVASIIEIIL